MILLALELFHSSIASLLAELGSKRLQLLREVLPNAALFGVLTDPASPGLQSRIADLQTSGSDLMAEVTTSELRLAFPSLEKRRTTRFSPST